MGLLHRGSFIEGPPYKPIEQLPSGSSGMAWLFSRACCGGDKQHCLLCPIFPMQLEALILAGGAQRIRRTAMLNHPSQGSKDVWPEDTEKAMCRSLLYELPITRDVHQLRHG